MKILYYSEEEPEPEVLEGIDRNDEVFDLTYNVSDDEDDEEECNQGFPISDYKEEKLNRSDFLVCETDELTFKVDYPLRTDFFFRVKNKGGFTLGEVCQAIVKIYKFIYRRQKEFRVYGHFIGDLYASEISMKDNIIMMIIDS
jgi:hypothetical protein